MRPMSADELRESYLRFFESKGHTRLPSASLVPKNDPSILLTPAGMAPFKPFFLGKAKPVNTRLATAQRCIRTPDIDNVGKTDRHGTFFEMLGNFSFGDYFKQEAILWAWEFVTAHLQLPPELLWVTVYENDDEAFSIWNQQVKVPVERIVRLGKKDNFWEIGVGPCGPCSEIYVDRGSQHGCGSSACAPGCDCERFLEFWNLVFIQFHKDEAGNYNPLDRKSIDTGMGLERTAALLQGVNSIFDTDIVRPIVDFVAEMAGIRYRQSPGADVSVRVITDHVRSVTFMAYDGILPSNEGRGYVMRRLLRRAVRHSRLLGIDGPFLAGVAERVALQMRHATPELLNELERVQRVLSQEEERFHETLDQGMSILSEIIEEVVASGGKALPGAEAFRLYDTFGFPLELTREIASDRGLSIDEAGFEQSMAGQRERARQARGSTGYLGNDDTDRYIYLAQEIRSRFIGYGQTEGEAVVKAILVDGRPADEAPRGTKCELILDQTPFYPEGGGQIADHGTITGPIGQFLVQDVRRPAEGLIVHRGEVVSGSVCVGDRTLATVAREERIATARHHTATHLLHKALRETLGTHVTQAGSLVVPDRLRFDFTHFQGLSEAELARIEERVNQAILQNMPVNTSETTYEEATRLGAMALFDEKYGDRVRLVSIGEYSKELCGGTHVGQTGELGLFQIVAETAVAAGVRRIEAVAGRAALAHVDRVEESLKQVAKLLDVRMEATPGQVERLWQQLKSMEKEVSQLKTKLAAGQTDALLATAERIGDISVIVSNPQGLDVEGLKTLGDTVRSRLTPCVIVMGTVVDGAVYLVSMASKELVHRGVHAGEVIKKIAPLVGGKGGGRPDIAQGGGKDASKLPEALDKARDVIKEQLAVSLHGQGR